MGSKNAAAAVSEVEELGPVRKALTALVDDEIRPLTQEALEGVERTRLAHEKALEAHAANPTDDNTRAVHSTWVAMQTAPAVSHRMSKVVLPRTLALIESEDVREVETLIAGKGNRAVFSEELKQHTAKLGKAVHDVANAVKAATLAHAQHVEANQNAKRTLKAVNKKLRTLVPDADLEAEFPYGSLDSFHFMNVRFALARTLKAELREALGKDKAYKLLDALKSVD